MSNGENISLNKKAVIIGLDGVPFSLLNYYMDQGVMPKFKSMAQQGALLPMRSSLPEVSSVAWSSFMTGENPAGHGIFGFMELDPQSYQFQFPNFTAVMAPCFWEKLGLPVVALNIPQTYPARPTNGILVSGFVALDLEKAVYPRKTLDYLQRMGYQLDVRSNLARTDPEAFFKNLFQTFEKRIEAITHLFENEDWRIFIGTITETDRLHHFFFDSARGGKFAHIFEEFYRRLDQFLHRIYVASQQHGALFLTCSDHGFTTIKSEVYVNRYLMEQGLLNISGSDGFVGMSADSRAFCLDPARVYLHRRDKYSRGSVSVEDFPLLRQEIKDIFQELTHNGDKVVRQVFLKDDIFSGPFVDNAPDLCVLAEPGFDLKSGLNKDQVFGYSHFTGAHTYEDAHVFISGAEEASLPANPEITDIPKLLYSWFSN